ncbi:MAG TPA: hydantoinase/oxoprolinase family protein [Cellulomonas sp.]
MSGGPHVRIGIDVGGTFTDLIAVSTRTGMRYPLKEPSTPERPSLAVLRGLERLIAETGLQAGEIASIAHGTTIGLNAVIQRRGARVALVVSRGHRDVLTLTRRLPEEYNLRQPHLEPLVPREHVVEIDARLDAAGGVVAVPDDAEITRVAERVEVLGAECVALTVLHSYLVPEFEQAVADRLSTALGGLPVAASAGLWPEIREYGRTSVVTINSYVTPLMTAYLDDLEAGLRARGVTAPLAITSSNGGSASIASARARPIDTMLSGPASGVTAAVDLAARSGSDRVITFDMGGTSSDISVCVRGEADFTTRTEIGGLPLIVPVVDVNAIGAGGGSVAWVDRGGMLHVGPESAGAAPGPAAYGLGGDRFTVTDAYLLAGVLAHDGVLAGRQRLDRDAAAKAAAPVAAELRIEGHDAEARVAAAVLDLATVGMAAELEKVLARRGHLAQDFTLMPFGGAGPTHAVMLAEEVGITRVVVPLEAGTFCALGAVAADRRRDSVRGLGRSVDDAAVAAASAYAAQMFAAGDRWLTEQGSPAAANEVLVSLQLRHVGQSYTLDLPVRREELPLSADQVTAAFHAEHERLFGHRDPGSRLTLVGVAATDLGHAEPLPVPAGRYGGAAVPRGRRRVHAGGRWHEAEVYDASALGIGLHVRGPALLDLPNTTVLVLDGWTLRQQGADSLTLDRQEAPAP